jgi:hypothetical protein
MSVIKGLLPLIKSKGESSAHAADALFNDIRAEHSTGLPVSGRFTVQMLLW